MRSAKAGRGYALPTLALAVLLAGCSRNASKPAVERIAILRFENLSSDISTDWMGRAFSEAIAAELAGAPGIYAIGSGRMHGLESVLGVRPVSAPGISTERALALASGANRVGYGEYWIRNGRIETRLTIEDPDTGKMTAAVSASAGGVLDAAYELARGIWAHAAPFGTRSQQALHAYVASLEASDPASAARDVEDAIAADADFGAPYERLAQLDGARGDRAGALATLDRALARGNAISGMARARIELQAAELRGDAAARHRSLATLARLDPANPEVWRSLGDAEMAAHAYQPAAAAYRKALAVEPDDVNALNQLGYAATYAGDPAGAVAALGRYRALRPAEANPLDSLGDVNLVAGRLRQAEEFYLQAARKDANFLAGGDWFKAAMARLMTGDIPGADTLHKQYLDARAAARDPAVAIRAAEWQWVTGRRLEACREMESFARGAATGPMREMAARALAELAVWNAVLGNRDAAARAVREAEALGGPSSAAIAGVAALLIRPPANPAPASGDSVRNLATACALLLDRRFQPAGELLSRLYAGAAPGSDEGIPIMLAWAYLETGRAAEAAPLLRFDPIPSPAGVSPLIAFYFPRLYQLRSIAAEKRGRGDEAAQNLRLFRRLSGPDPLVWER